MIALQLLSTPQGPMTDEPERRFADESITIGRAPNCQLVLPDGLRIISRQHVRLTVQRGEVLLSCLSASAPVRVNDSAVPHGGVYALRGGDLIHIGGFVLRLNEVALPTSPPGSSSAGALDAGERAGGGTGADASLAPAHVPPQVPPQVPPHVPTPAAPHVPAEWPEPGARPAAADRPGGRGRARLDEWFDLEPALPAGTPPTHRAPGGEGLPSVHADVPIDLDLRSGAYATEAQAADLRVFESLQQVLAARVAQPPPEIESSSEAIKSSSTMQVDVPISVGIVAPEPQAQPAALQDPSATIAVVNPAPAGRPLVDEAVAPGRVSRSAPRPETEPTPGMASPTASGAAVASAAAAAHAPLPSPASTPAIAPAPATASAPSVAAMLAALDDDDRMALVQAFLDGAGLAQRAGATSTQVLAPITLTPAWMRHVGQLLRASVEGVLALLHSRSTVKREMRAEVTVIARRQNNPLKFAPDSLAALAHLLAAKRSPGFLEPVAAVKDAHEDLLVHHLAVVAGMRAAMFELIARLGPDDVIRDEGPVKGLAATMPSLHEAALWRRYRQRHAEMTARLDDDFETVFGREFTKAYEAQARRVRDQSPPEGTLS